MTPQVEAAGRPEAFTFQAVCSLIEELLGGEARRALVAELAAAGDCRAALLRLRDSMQSHAWKIGPRRIALGRFVKALDALTRVEGFHVLNDWDGKADRVSENTIPVDVLDYLMAQRGSDAPNAASLAILLDYYLANVLALCALRIWDDGDADANLDRVNGLLRQLQDANGSGQRFADNAETLILIATSHFEVVEIGYEKLLARVRTLNRSHQTNIALGHAVSMGSHLRFGFEATYGRDTVVMRDDNVADYPWLCFALVTAMREYVRLREEHVEGAERDRVVEALVNGLSSDPRAFIGQAPASLSRAEADRSEFAELFLRHRGDLLPEFERYRPRDEAYSPLSFFFNFSHNVLKGTVVDALLRGKAWDISFNDLLTALPRVSPEPRSGDGGRDKQELATTLMGYARRNPDRIRGKLMPVIVYDPATGREAFTAAMRKLREPLLRSRL
jgi:hypothetical protein